jgi:uncharacterized protein
VNACLCTQTSCCALSRTASLPRRNIFDRLLQRAEAGEVALVTNALVMAEIVWTLESYYGLSPADIRPKVWAMLNTPGLEVMVEADLVGAAADIYAEKNVDFMDAFNAEWMKQRGTKTTCTLDRCRFGRQSGPTVDLSGELAGHGNGLAGSADRGW